VEGWGAEQTAGPGTASMAFMHTPKTARFALLALLVGSIGAAAQAGTRLEVVFDDPAALYGAYYSQIEQVTLAAGNSWIGHFGNGGIDSELSVSISFADIATAQGHSVASALFGPGPGGASVYAQGAAYEFLTGIDANGSAADIHITLGINGYLQDELWFDPSPTLRLGSVPADRTDAMSVLMHEFGHALGFNGWRDGFSGMLSGDYQSSFDALVQPQTTEAGTALYFHGAQAVSLYGGPVPLTVGVYGHLGNSRPTMGDDLMPDLMNGVTFYRGARYEISALNLGMMQDLGFTLASPVPEPGGLALGLAGLAALLAWRRSR
jgi:MYXO-CTERM domain-containing protein